MTPMNLRKSLYLFVTLAASLLVNCSGAGPDDALESGIDKVRYSDLRILAESDLMCDRRRIGYEYVGEKVHLLRGCGREIRYLVFMYRDVWVEIVSFHDKASFDLGCAADKLEAKYLDQGVWRVAGCGRTAKYMLQCDRSGSNCDWMVDI